MISVGLSRLLNKISEILKGHWTQKYGKYYKITAPNKNEKIYIIHCIFSFLILILDLYYYETFPNVWIWFTMEAFILFCLVMINPCYKLDSILLPMIGIMLSILINGLIFVFIGGIRLFDINSLGNGFTVTINATFCFIILINIMEDNKTIELNLKVKSKKSLDYLYSQIVFEDKEGKIYTMITDLHKFFLKEEIYKIKLKKKNIEVKNENGSKVNVIKDIDASKFVKQTLI